MQKSTRVEIWEMRGGLPPTAVPNWLACRPVARQAGCEGLAEPTCEGGPLMKRLMYLLLIALVVGVIVMVVRKQDSAA